MFYFLNLAQIAISIMLIVVILLQQKGSGLSGVFGGEGNFYRTKRGFERFLFIATILLATLFIGSALFRVLFEI